MNDTASLAGKGALSLCDFLLWSGLGRTKALEEITSGRLHAVKVGRRLLIPVASAYAWLAGRPPVRARPAADEAVAHAHRHGRPAS